ncbi:hypothetical protein BFJ70_g15568 [Fusarium oxysporum]|nr:hypothetical protein BFJ70_g15568 [Fusarium oxysporum]
MTQGSAYRKTDVDSYAAPTCDRNPLDAQNQTYSSDQRVKLEK